MFINGSQVENDKKTRADFCSRIFCAKTWRKKFIYPCAEQYGREKIGGIYHVKRQDLDTCLKNFTPPLLSLKQILTFRKLRVYVNLTFRKDKSINPNLPDLKKFEQNDKLQNGLRNEMVGIIFQL